MGAIGGCSAVDASPPAQITFSTGACESRCPVWEATVTETGGVFRGGAFSRITGERRFALTRKQYHSFAAALAPVRSKGEQTLYPGQNGCEDAPTDMRTIHVTWDDRDRLSFYTGCEGPQNAQIRDALMKAERLLPGSRLAGE